MKPSVRKLAVLCTLAVLTSACASQPPSPTNTPVPISTPTAAPSPTPLPSSTSPPPTATSTPTSTATPYPIFRDDFAGTLQPGWTWLRENDSKWSLTSEPGFLRIVLEGGSFHRNLFIREVESEDFEITTHVLFKPTTNFQIAALLVYQDDATMIKFGRAFCDVQNLCVGNGIYFDNMQNAQFSGTNYATDTVLQDEAYLRITKIGSRLTGSYSEDGTNWMVIGVHESFMADPKVGLVAGQSNVVGAIALFDYFTLMEIH